MGRFADFVQATTTAILPATRATTTAFLPATRTMPPTIEIVPTTPAIEVSPVIPPRKRGRPSLWTPSLADGTEPKRFEALVNEYGPSELGGSDWVAKYGILASLNPEKSERELTAIAIVQSKEAGLEYSTLLGYFKSLWISLGPPADRATRQSRYNIKVTLAAAAADADRKQPRPDVTDWNPDRLLQGIKAVPDATTSAMCWLCLVTGARPCDAWRLGHRNLELKENSLMVEWRVRKAQRKRSERHREEYLFSWSAPPLDTIRAFIISLKPGSFPFKVAMTKKGCSTAVTMAMRKGTGDVKITSYIFRDHLSKTLKSLGFSPERIKRLLDLLHWHSGAGRSKKPSLAPLPSVLNG